MSTALPTLTMAGFVHHPQAILIKLYEYFLTSNYSQSITYFGKISSLPYIIRDCGSDLEELKYQIRETFGDMVENYLTQLTIKLDAMDIVVETFQQSNSNDVIVSLDVNLVIAGVSYDLVEEINLNSTSFLNKSKRLNYLYNGEL